MEKNEPASNGRPPVVFLPGGISPAAVTYGLLLEVLKDEVRLLLKDLEVYAADTPPPWMVKRVANDAAMYRAYNDYHLDRERLRHFRQPVYLALGTLSPPIFERNAKLLSSLFPNMRLEVYEGRQHLDPPHRAEPERFARALRELWARSETGTAISGQ